MIVHKNEKSRGEGVYLSEERGGGGRRGGRREEKGGRCGERAGWQLGLTRTTQWPTAQCPSSQHHIKDPTITRPIPYATWIKPTTNRV